MIRVGNIRTNFGAVAFVLCCGLRTTARSIEATTGLSRWVVSAAILVGGTMMVYTTYQMHGKSDGMAIQHNMGNTYFLLGVVSMSCLSGLLYIFTPRGGSLENLLRPLPLSALTRSFIMTSPPLMLGVPLSALVSFPFATVIATSPAATVAVTLILYCALVLCYASQYMVQYGTLLLRVPQHISRVIACWSVPCTVVFGALLGRSQIADSRTVTATLGFVNNHPVLTCGLGAIGCTLAVGALTYWQAKVHARDWPEYFHWFAFERLMATPRTTRSAIMLASLLRNPLVVLAIATSWLACLACGFASNLEGLGGQALLMGDQLSIAPAGITLYLFGGIQSSLWLLKALALDELRSSLAELLVIPLCTIALCATSYALLNVGGDAFYAGIAEPFVGKILLITAVGLLVGLVVPVHGDSPFGLAFAGMLHLSSLMLVSYTVSIAPYRAVLVLLVVALLSVWAILMRRMRPLLTAV